MIKALKRLLAGATLSTLLLAPLAFSGTAFAQNQQLTGVNIASCGANGQLTASGGQYQCPPDTQAASKVNSTVKLAVNTFSVIVGLVCVIMIIVGGLKYVTSQGESGNVSGAKNTILYAIVGLVIVALAQVIVNFVLVRVSGGSA